MEFPVYSRNALRPARGCGYTIVGSDGRTYHDFYAGHAVAALGYDHPSLRRAIIDQTSRLHFQSNACELDVRQAACVRLVELAPEGLDAVFFVNSGAEANENALRLAFMRTRRKTVVALRGAFHGRTAAAGAASDGNAAWYGFPAAPFPVTWVRPNDVDALGSALTEEVAAFIFEPIQGLAGAVPLDAAFLQHARHLCTKRGIVMIADEVQTGIGRSGYLFAVEPLGVKPDLLTLAKGLAGGFPAAALLAPAEWARDLGIGSFGTTFGGGPIACAAMLAVLEEVSKPGFLEHVRRISARLMVETCVGPVQSVSGRGLLIGLRCSRPAKDVSAELLDKGMIVGDSKNPAVVRLLPPLIVDDEAVDALVAALGEVKA